MSSKETNEAAFYRLMKEQGSEDAWSHLMQAVPVPVQALAAEAAITAAGLSDREAMLKAMELDEVAGNCITGVYRVALETPQKDRGEVTPEAHALMRMRGVLARVIFRRNYYDAFPDAAASATIPPEVIYGGCLAQLTYHASQDTEP